MRARLTSFLLAAALLALPTHSAAAPERTIADADDDEGYVRRVKVEPRRLKNGVILFPTWDHPRVRAFMLSDEFLGPSMLDAEPVVERVPLVRPAVGVQTSREKADARDRRLARRYARQLVRQSREELTQCYESARVREPVPYAQVVFGFEVGAQRRGLVHVDRGHLVDRDGDRCARSVLDRVAIDAPLPTRPLRVAVPVWFWMHTVEGP